MRGDNSVVKVQAANFKIVKMSINRSILSTHKHQIPDKPLQLFYSIIIFDVLSYQNEKKSVFSHIHTLHSVTLKNLLCEPVKLSSRADAFMW